MLVWQVQLFVGVRRWLGVIVGCGYRFGYHSACGGRVGMLLSLAVVRRR